MTLLIICFVFGGACLIAAARLGYGPEDELEERWEDWLERRHIDRLADRRRKGRRKRSRWAKCG